MQRAIGSEPLALSAPGDPAPLIAALVLVGWAALMAALHPAQFADSIEQYNWAHSLEWGYWKHPPLSTWLMRAAIDVIGVSHWTAPVLAALCLATSVAFVWRIACMVLPPRAAQVAILLWPLHQALATRAEVYNHNTVLVLFASMTAWACMRAEKSHRTRDWAVAGVCMGLAMLAKYQAAVTILGVLVALWRVGYLDARPRRAQVALALLIAAAVFAPHAAWALHHALSTVQYVESSAPHVAFLDRPEALLRFTVVQLRMLAFVLVAAAAVRTWPLRNRANVETGPGDAEWTRAWLAGLVVVPVLVVVIAVLAGGFKPQKMWGVHTVLYLPLWFGWRIARVRPEAHLARRTALAALAVTAATAAYAVAEVARPGWNGPLYAIDRTLPAHELAQAAVRDWYQQTSCPLKLVMGSAFPAGLVSVYSGAYPVVVEDEDYAKTPWVTPGDVRARGAIEIGGPSVFEDIPPGASFMLVSRSSKGDDRAAIWWRVVKPENACE